MKKVLIFTAFNFFKLKKTHQIHYKSRGVVHHVDNTYSTSLVY